MIMALFMDRGDSLLMEEYSYPVVTGARISRHLMPVACRRQCCVLAAAALRQHMPAVGIADRRRVASSCRFCSQLAAESLAQPKGLHAIPVPIDSQGIVPQKLAEVRSPLIARILQDMLQHGMHACASCSL
jgi:hypothetical protein